MSYRRDYRDLIKTVVGPLAIVKSCTICGFSDIRKPGKGRGSGLRNGNKSRGRIIQHIQAQHPEGKEEG